MGMGCGTRYNATVKPPQLPLNAVFFAAATDQVTEAAVEAQQRVLEFLDFVTREFLLQQNWGLPECVCVPSPSPKTHKTTLNSS